MENATKALIIAASVLIVIVLIAVGIKILGSAQGVTNDVDRVTEATGQAYFNSQYTDYAGIQKGTQVKAVLNKAAASCRTDSTRKVTVTMGGATYNTSSGISSLMSSINVTQSYTVSVTIDDTTGYVTGITIS